jgi:histone-lysine N-methyltransferase SETMAR
MRNLVRTYPVLAKIREFKVYEIVISRFFEMEATRDQLRACAYMLLKNGSTAKNAKQSLDTAFGKHAPAYSTVALWFKEFRGGRRSLDDLPRSGRPPTAVTEENIAAVQKLIEEDPHIPVRKMRSILKIGTAALYSIVHDKLRYRKLCTRWVPRELTEEQKRERVNWCKMMLRNFKNGGSKRVFDIVTTDETWLYFYDPTTKRDSRVWVRKGESAPVKAKKTRSVKKRMFALFFRKGGFVSMRMLKHGATVNGKWYRRTVGLALGQIRKRRPKTGLRGLCFHQDNASPHKAHLTIEFLARKKICLTGHPAYSPDLAPLDFFYNNRIKNELRGKYFRTEKELLRETEKVIAGISKAEHTWCFQRWFHRMHQCIAVNGQYFEKVKTVLPVAHACRK